MTDAPAAAASAPTHQDQDQVDVVLWAAKAGVGYLSQIVDALTQYKETGTLPADLVAAANAPEGPKKRGKAKLPKLNKDGSVKQPRKPTAYNHWMQAKLKELKAAADHNPNEKHVDTFKEAAAIWGQLPKGEKDRIAAEFKAQDAAGAGAANGSAPHPEDVEAVVQAAAVAAEEVSSEETGSDESSEEEETAAPAPKPAAPKPLPIPIPQATPAAEEPSKKKKKRKSEPAMPVPVASPTASEGGKKKKNKKAKKDKV